jgi:hypothetical protein
MSDNEKRTKPKYEAPTVVPLGELAQGTGYCSAGSVVDGYCSAGFAASGGYCEAGTVVSGYCRAGTFGSA